MSLVSFLENLNSAPDNIEFSDVIELIDNMYHFTPSRFKNADLVNEAGQNNGSCKLFAFGQLHNLTEQQMLACFGAYYREEVLRHPEANDHQNIRNFINNGWSGIEYSGTPLVAR